MPRMTRTLRLPEELDGATLISYSRGESQAVRASEHIARLELDGQAHMIVADADGVVLRLLLKPGLRLGGGAPLAILGDAGENMGYDPSAIRSVRVSLLRRCEECGNDYPVNGLVESVRCTRCGDLQASSRGFWRNYLSEHVNAASEPSVGSGGSVLAGQYGASTVQCWGIPPLCRKYFALLQWNALAEAWEHSAREAPSAICCGACGERHRARLPPAWAVEVFSRLAFLVGETADDTQSAEVPRPVIFKCPSCGAGLGIDGVKRIVHCAYCDSDVYLPDDLWLHFNPSAKRGRWWMLLRA